MNTIMNTANRLPLSFTDKAWNEKTPTEQRTSIAIALTMLASVVFFALNSTGVWTSNLHLILLGVSSLIEYTATWSTNRSVAILNLIASSLFFLLAVL